MHDFTPGSALLGGVLIGLSASLLLLVNGRVAGITGIVAGLLEPVRGELAWRAAFVAGLVLGGIGMLWAMPGQAAALPGRSVGAVAVAGVIVGFGTRMGNGCTSGHGVCGIPRGSARSIAATMTFIATGMVSVFVVEHLLGGAL